MRGSVNSNGHSRSKDADVGESAGVLVEPGGLTLHGEIGELLFVELAAEFCLQCADLESGLMNGDGDRNYA